MKWSLALDSRCAVRRTSHACGAVCERLLPCFCSVTAFLLLAHRFLVPKLPCAKSKPRLTFALHHTTLFSSFLIATIPLLDIHLVLIRFGLHPLSASFIHAYSFVQSCSDRKSKGLFLFHSVCISVKETPFKHLKNVKNCGQRRAGQKRSGSAI